MNINIPVCLQHEEPTFQKEKEINTFYFDRVGGGVKTKDISTWMLAVKIRLWLNGEVCCRLVPKRPAPVT